MMGRFESDKSLVLWQAFVRDESGATAIEYSLMAALVGIAIISGMKVMGSSINNVLTTASTELSNSVP
ncbi:MAG: Flp family type IVb pilin [Alphaproteobacteria bacterium]